jgi:hypothetical protein
MDHTSRSELQPEGSCTNAEGDVYAYSADFSHGLDFGAIQDPVSVSASGFAYTLSLSCKIKRSRFNNGFECSGLDNKPHGDQHSPVERCEAVSRA